ncbi:MAG: hypothetical protein ACLFSE_06100 [Spirochaetia bacterium]
MTDSASGLTLYKLGNKFIPGIQKEQDSDIQKRILELSSVDLGILELSHWYAWGFKFPQTDFRYNFLLNINRFITDENNRFPDTPLYFSLEKGVFQRGSSLKGKSPPDLVIEDYGNLYLDSNRREHFKRMTEQNHYFSVSELFELLPALEYSHGRTFWEVNQRKTGGYGIPLYSFQLTELPGFWLIPKEVLEKSGVPKIRSRDDFLSFLRSLAEGNPPGQGKIHTSGIPAGTIWMDMYGDLMPIEIEALSEGKSRTVWKSEGEMVRRSRNLIPTPFYYKLPERKVINILESPPPGLHEFMDVIRKLSEKGMIDQNTEPSAPLRFMDGRICLAQYIPRDHAGSVLQNLCTDPELFKSVTIVPLSLGFAPKASLTPRFFLAVPRETSNMDGIISLFRTLINPDYWTYIRYGENPELFPEESALEILTRNCNYESYNGLLPDSLAYNFYIDDRVPNSFRLFPFGKSDLWYLNYQEDEADWNSVYQKFTAVLMGLEQFSAGTAEILEAAGKDLDNLRIETDTHIRRVEQQGPFGHIRTSNFR